jgi:hypothetical protein
MFAISLYMSFSGNSMMTMMVGVNMYYFYDNVKSGMITGTFYAGALILSVFTQYVIEIQSNLMGVVYTIVIQMVLLVLVTYYFIRVGFN